MLKITGPKSKAPKVQYEANPKFGTVFGPYCLRMIVQQGQTDNFKAEIFDFKTIDLSPGTAALHYGQSIFEGMKAYHQKDGGVAVFRADLHAKRFRRSAKKMVMAEIPEEIFLEAIKAFVKASADQVPTEPGHSLYLRPLLFAADPVIKVGTSNSYEFLIMSTIAGGYFQSGQSPQPAKVMVGRSFVRAFPGGTGEAKTASNYAASIPPNTAARKLGCDQVLYLDAIEHDYIDELGGMNFFLVKGRKLITPALNGCILEGVTRQSILQLASSLDLEPVEARMSMTELAADIESGKVLECFACGTAAVVSPIGAFYYQEKLNGEFKWINLKGPNTYTEKIHQKLSQVQRGQIEAPGDWLFKV